MAQHMLTAKELADRWATSVAALANWRSAERGPAYVKLGRRVRYRLDDVERFEREHTVTQS